MKMSRSVKAYFTVEAAMVLSIVLSVIVMVVYIMFFQYNRCLMEQDAGTLILKSCTMQIDDKNTLLQELKQQEGQIYRDKYVAWQNRAAVWKIERNKIRVEQTGAILFPFAKRDGINQESRWEATVVYENGYLSPVSFLRTYHKLTGGK